MAKGRETFRFAVGKPEGPRAHVWLLSPAKNSSDVYITGYGFRRSEKVSLHEHGWRKAFLEEDSPFVSPGEDRATDKWKRPPEFAPEVTKALEIIVPASEVTMPQRAEAKPDWEGKEIAWVPSPPEGFATYFTVVYTAPDITARNLEITWETEDGLHRYRARQIWRTELLNGQALWVVTHERPITEAQKEQLDRYKAAAKQAIGVDRFSAMVDPRAYLWRYDADGTRFFLDVSLASMQD